MIWELVFFIKKDIFKSTLLTLMDLPVLCKGFDYYLFFSVEMQSLIGMRSRPLKDGFGRMIGRLMSTELSMKKVQRQLINYLFTNCRLILADD